MINRSSTIMRFNPLTHLFAIWREPLSTGHVALESLIYVLACLAVLTVASLVAVTHLRKAAFWI
jgi:ABC-type polysaccharide/polyol phosphate export permease